LTSTRSDRVQRDPEVDPARQKLEAGTARERAVGTEKMVTLIRLVGDSYFLALTMRPDGNFGKGRYLMRTAAPKLLEQLS
jgi:predicted regulator of Ras-like GTPase activity (Roadblock/LC7/MglB family)